MDKIDATIGAGANGITSGTRPSSPFANQLIRETDTRRMYVWNPTQSTWDQISVAGASQLTQYEVERTTTSDHAFRTKVTGEGVHRLIVQADGRMSWGNGSSSDVVLYRSGPNVLRLEDAFNPDSIVNEGKIFPSYQNSWTDWGNPWQGAAYWKDKNGIVHISGLIKGGTVGQAAFTLPAGYRPATNGNLLFVTLTGANVLGRIDVESSGAVRVAAAGSNSLVSLSGISFKAEA